MKIWFCVKIINPIVDPQTAAVLRKVLRRLKNFRLCTYLLLGEMGIVAGWGRLSEGGQLPSILQYVSKFKAFLRIKVFDRPIFSNAPFASLYNWPCKWIYAQEKFLQTILTKKLFASQQLSTLMWFFHWYIVSKSNDGKLTWSG